jgi:cobalt/nickel transport system permease protein
VFFSIATLPGPTPGILGMHAPDGFLSVGIAAVMWAVTLVVLAVAVARTNTAVEDRTAPLMGVMAAFIFAAQMFNFQVIGGTSGHLLGGVLAAVLLRPWAATLVMACVVAVQGLVFQDGGLVVMGANIFNMGIIGTLFGYAIYRAVAAVLGGEDRGRLPAAAIAAWSALVLASLAVSIELALSGTVALEVALPAMVGIHALIGIGEALITVAALAFIQVARKDLFMLRDSSPTVAENADAGDRSMTEQSTAPGGSAGAGRFLRRWGWVAAGLAIAAIVVVALAPLASPDPDGLESVAEEQGWLGVAQDWVYQMLPDYTIPGLDGAASTIVAGLIGVGVVFLATAGLGWMLRRRGTSRA